MVALVNWLAVLAGPVIAKPFQQQQAVLGPSQDIQLRDIHIGDINFIHTTDTHGWLGSHFSQENYDADWGDFVSFVDILRQTMSQLSRDVIVIDTGDKRDGNGLSDATWPPGLRSSKIFNMLDYDLLTLGNHELYTAESAILEYRGTSQSAKFKDKYVCSNVEFIEDDGERVPFGNKYITFETPIQKQRVLALSFLFSFQRANNRAIVTPPLEEIMEKGWFQNMVETNKEEDIDLIVVFGHLPATDPTEREMHKIHALIRKCYPNTVIQYFGGHTHIRDFVQLDSKSTCLQSGRFAETIGFLSINMTSAMDAENPIFTRRYIDFNKESFKHHLSKITNDTNVPSSTKKGGSISRLVEDLRLELNLNQKLGNIPQTYYVSTRPLDSDENIYHLITHKVLPNLIPSKNYEPSMSRFILINTGSVRYDLYKGPFTKDTEYIVMPFNNDWHFITVPLVVASRIESYLNKGPVIASLGIPSSSHHKQRVGIFQKCPFINDPNLNEGYTTEDDFGCHGDDTPHNSQREFDIPNVVQCKEVKMSNEEKPDPMKMVHVIFYTFMELDILNAANSIINNLDLRMENLTTNDCSHYGGDSTKKLLRDYFAQF
ncbi:YHR202W [Saccharomyces arboricola H-6]|uniref:YHR202W n=1 Tax=Saccharomyces arboricola (strain H-6 / AS 2.3317 / CBS 10644) TaxID=1160507 RepID=J8Q410_SACAR|nr:YHR202W [Saccharomyces arboricola H-6]